MLKIQFLNGGLANQAFQYIFVRHFELSHPGEIMYMDDSYFALNTVHNGYELEKVFGIKPHMISEVFDADVWEYMLEQKKQGKSIPQILKDNGMDIDMVTETSNYMEFNPFDGTIYIGNANAYDPDVQCVERNTYFHGYWIHKNWFQQYRLNMLKAFQFPPVTDAYNQSLMERILNERSAAIHIRRGDFVKVGIAYEVDTYEKMINRYLECFGGETTLFVFSDDIAWCKQNGTAIGMDKFKECVFVEGNVNGKNYIDLYLMSLCKYMIIGNSSFAFLAALLNTQMIGYINASQREF